MIRGQALETPTAMAAGGPPADAAAMVGGMAATDPAAAPPHQTRLPRARVLAVLRLHPAPGHPRCLLRALHPAGRGGVHDTALESVRTARLCHRHGARGHRHCRHPARLPADLRVARGRGGPRGGRPHPSQVGRPRRRGGRHRGDRLRQPPNPIPPTPSRSTAISPPFHTPTCSALRTPSFTGTTSPAAPPTAPLMPTRSSTSRR